MWMTFDGSTTEQTIMARSFSKKIFMYFLLFQGVSLFSVFIFSLLSTSAVFYTVACVYTAKDVSFRKIITVVVPKVCKRLMASFLWKCLVFFVYISIIYFLLFLYIIIFFKFGGRPIVTFLGIIIILLYILCSFYISIVWYLSSVVSVLEDTYGIAASRKSMKLIRGKEWVVALIYLLTQMMSSCIVVLFINVVVLHSTNSWVVAWLVYAPIILAALTLVWLMALVVQTVLYFICKSYHHENIDKSSLSIGSP
ncbi:hypothetical protein ZOSMA_81G00330 [Zostera marina]|uniref:Uncharacterized protein n=1 Tax=Zostera marina TaxID=29655 RepID=A0A0K9NM21_ZOSMR|nr:hypothetical protein ZOSMA_81G00330 [Zostera marina]